MLQLLLHLFGDYIIQTSWMAKWKVRNTWVAAIHALTYTLPFLILTTNWISLSIIYSTHLWIDRFSLAKYIMTWKGTPPNDKYVFDTNLEYRPLRLTSTGWVFNEVPDKFEYPIYSGNLFLIYVVTDNTLHLIINYLALMI